MASNKKTPNKRFRKSTNKQTRVDGDVNGTLLSGEVHGPVEIDNRKIESPNYIEGGQNNTIDNRQFHFTASVGTVVAVVIIALVSIGVLAYYLFAPPPTPAKMSKDFNIAVAEIPVMDAQGSVIDSQDGSELSQFLYDRLNVSFKEMSPNILHEIWNYDRTGRIAGATPEERRAAAQSRAEEINAHVLIYGVIVQDGDRSAFSPEFYVNYQGFENNAPEVLGGNQLGRSFAVDLPFQREIAASGGNPVLVARSEALSLLTIGLAYYANDDYESALLYFDRAVQIDKWLDGAGKEVAYLLRGNARMRRASLNKDFTDLPFVLEDYTKAWEISDQTYGRALVGMGGVYYLEAIDDPTAVTNSTVDIQKLDQAEKIFQQALALPDQPTSYNIFAKAHFSLGQVYQLRSLNLGEAGMDAKASEEYTQVLQKYEAGDHTLKEIASYSYARLGLLSFIQGNHNEAENYYKKAYEIASPRFKAEYSGYLGIIYLEDGKNQLALGEESSAREKFANAKRYLQIALEEAEAVADQNLIDTFQPAMDQLMNEYGQYIDAAPAP